MKPVLLHGRIRFVLTIRLRVMTLGTGHLLRGGGGGLQKGRGGACEVLPLRKGGGGKNLFSQC